MTDPHDWRDGPLPDEPALPPELDPRRPGRRAVGTGAPARSVPRQVGRALSWGAAGLSVAIVAGTAFGYVTYRQANANITHIDALSDPSSGDGSTPAPAKAPKGARNVLIVGSDTRDIEGSAAFQGKGAEFVSGQRSDTIILAHLYGGRNEAAQLISFPRDSWVTVPAWTDPKTKKVTKAHEAKINSAITTGGPALLVRTVEQLTGIKVDGYVQIDFAGFQTMVNNLGGVQVCLTKAAKEPDSGINLKAGRQTISGAQALAFVRQRKELPRGDIDRIARQQHFIASLVRKTVSAGTLTRPDKLRSLALTATKNLTVDEDTGLDDLIELGTELSGVSAGGIAFATVPYTDLGGRRDGQSVVLLDKAKMATLFGAIRADQVPPGLSPGPETPAAPPPPAPSGLIVAPSAIRVSVFNGGGTKGLAARAATELKAQGFVLSGTAGNRGSGTTGTVVRYGPAKADSAKTLAASLPGSTLQPVSSLGSTLEVVVGSGYVSPVAVTIDPAPGTGPTATPTPGTGSAPPLQTAATEGCVN